MHTFAVRQHYSPDLALDAANGTRRPRCLRRGYGSWDILMNKRAAFIVPNLVDALIHQRSNSYGPYTK
ncbi:hypothetical protein HGH93_09505 [Chitinophaga polysaccharea]|uniref:hypothetical protein n=1 Tax=Chitinophaga TaxID=79328 RepID=UPI001455B875|nr:MULTISPECIES: hypothetical protein [Chitinophaga]NLR58334.1 hypothetical protein [Chitinophaga polysaccharea]NLU90860.1 hypothetical protein [Chitinophaga sp. Ak27]